MFKLRVNINERKTDSARNILKNKALIIIIVINKIFSTYTYFFHTIAIILMTKQL